MHNINWEARASQCISRSVDRVDGGSEPMKVNLFITYILSTFRQNNALKIARYNKQIKASVLNTAKSSNPPMFTPVFTI